MSHKYYQVMADWSRDMVKLLHWSADTCLDPATGSRAHSLKGGVHKNHFSRQIHSRNCAKGYEGGAMSSTSGVTKPWRAPKNPLRYGGTRPMPITAVIT